MTLRPRGEFLAHALTGIVLLLAVAVLAVDLAGNPALSQLRARDPGPGFQPRITLVLLGLAAVWLIASGLRKYFRGTSGERGETATLVLDELRRMILPVAMIVSLVAFVWLAQVIGFLPVGILFTVGWAIVIAIQDMGTGRGRDLLVAAVSAALFAIGVYLLFKSVIGVPL